MTIVVLIILAGISIGAIVGDNGIISKSKEAKEEAGKMQNSTAQDRDSLYGELVGEKNQYEESGTVGLDLQLEKQTDTSIIATANATDTKSEIISYTFYIRKITENDSAYVTIKKSDKLTKAVTCSNLEKDMGYKVKVVAMDKDGVSKTAEKNIVLGEAIKISVVPISGPDSYPSTVMVTATSVVSNMDYIELPNGEKIEAKNGKFKLKTTYNSTKNGPIVFTAYDKEGNAGQLEYMEQNVINFETEWTFAEETTITVPVTGTVDVYIDYGDGTKENIASANPNHTYAVGTYVMKISGKCDKFEYNKFTKNYLTKLEKWGCLENKSYKFGGISEEDNGWSGCSKMTGNIPQPHDKSFRSITDAGYLFYRCTGLTGSIPTNLFHNATKMNSLSYAFSECKNLTGNIPENLFANCLNVTLFNGTFYNCSGLTESIPENLFCNNTKVTGFGSLFYNCSNLIGEIPKGLFDSCKNTNYFTATFKGCVNLSGRIPDGLFANKTQCISFERAFEGCSNLIGEMPENLFLNCPNTKNLNFVFNGCSNLTEIPSNLFNNINNGEDNIVTSMMGMFNECRNIAEIPVGLFDKCPEVTAFGIWYQYGGLFRNCKKITKIPSDLFKNCTKVKDMTQVFSGTSITEIPKGLLDNCTEITKFGDEFYGGMFSNCPITEIPEGLFDNCVNASNFASIFSGCHNLTIIPAGLFDNCTKVTNFTKSFFNCTNLIAIPDNLFDNCTEVTTFSATFALCSSLISIPEALFDNCKKVDNFGANKIDTTNFNSGGGTFAHCTSLTGKAPELWNRSNVTSYYYCFRDCTGLENYDDIPDDWK